MPCLSSGTFLSLIRPSSGYIDSGIEAQMFVAILTLKIGFAGIYMSFIVVIEVILISIFGHDVTSHVMFCCSCCCFKR